MEAIYPGRREDHDPRFGQRGRSGFGHRASTADPTDGADLVAAAKALASGTDSEMAAAIDFDEFTRVSVTRSVMGSTDSFSEAVAGGP